jgi:hypothetical protein
MDDAVETSAQRVRDHLRRPIPGSRDLLMETAGNTVSANVTLMESTGSLYSYFCLRGLCL